MKKLLSIALCAAAVSAFGETATPIDQSLGTVGVTKIESKLTNTIVAVSYDDLTGCSGIVISNFVKTTNLTKGDQLAVFSNGVYSTWRLEQVGDTGPKYWAKNDKEFTVGSDGKLQAGTGSAASDVTHAFGSGIWLVRKTPTDSHGDAIPFYIYGKPVSSPTSTTVAGAWTLIGNPTQTEIDLNTVVIDNVAPYDQVVAIGEDGNPKYYNYKAGKVNAWQRNNGGEPEDLPKIGAGLGVWIRTASPATIHWTEEVVKK